MYQWNQSDTTPTIFTSHYRLHQLLTCHDNLSISIFSYYLSDKTLQIK